jgi:hypothetical protein
MTTPSVHLDRRLERITTHLRAHVAELRRLERAGGTPREVAERREVIARLQSQLAGLVKAAVAPARDPVGAHP